MHLYDLRTNELAVEVPIGTGNANQCIKCNELEQNEDGSYFALPYMDDGKFYVKTFGIDQEIRLFNINTSFGIDDWS